MKNNFEDKKVVTDKKKVVLKSIRKAFRPKNIGRFLILAATIALLLTSIVPYLF